MAAGSGSPRNQSVLTAGVRLEPRSRRSRPPPVPRAAPRRSTRRRRRPRSHRRAHRDVAKAFRSRRARAEGRPPGAGPGGVRPRGRRHARVAVRRADRCPHPRAFRPADRSDQRLRGDSARPGRRLRREEVRAGVDRRTAEDRDLPEAGCRRRRRPPRSSRTSRPPSTTCRFRRTAACCAYVELFQGRLRDFIQDGLTRGTKYLPMIQSVFRAEGLPLDLAYIPIIESGFKTNALSKASAKGPWQFMRATAIENGLHHDWYVDERSDPEKATIAAAKYLKTLSKMFDGDWNLVLAAYNGGLGRVQRAMKTRRQGRLLGAVRSSSQVPAEGNARVRAAHPRGDDRREEPGAVRLRHRRARRRSRTTRSPVPRAIDLRRVAEWTGTSHRRDPGAEPGAAALDDAGEVPGLPAEGARRGPARRSRRAWPTRRPSDLTALKWYTVKGAESLATIARKLQGQPHRSRGSQQPVDHVARPRRAGADHPARARDAAGGAHRTNRAGRTGLAAGDRHRHGRRRAAARRRARSSTGSSAATRCPPSRSCSTPPSRASSQPQPASRQRRRRRHPAEDRALKVGRPPDRKFRDLASAEPPLTLRTSPSASTISP